jgi:aryl-alcohol dehydrogenase-like predicted oxidoreductase
MKYRPFGKTGITVSEIGLGAWQLANPDWGLDDKTEAAKIVQEALDLGCNFFDTAPGYGNGRSEEILGNALKGVRKDIVICSKYSHYTNDEADFSAKTIRPVLEESFKRLQTDYIDIYITHNPPREQMDGRNTDMYEELDKLKQEGKIREYGISLDWREELETMMDTTKSKAAEVFFNALYQEPLPAFKRAEEEGVGLIVKVPLDSGWLSGKYRSKDTKFDDVRNRWSPEVIARRADLVEKFATLVPPGMSLTHAALQYCLATPGISTVIPGPKSVAQTRDNFSASDVTLPPESIKGMKELWDREIAHDPLPW